MSPSSNGELRLAVYHPQPDRDTERERDSEGAGGEIGRVMKMERSVNERESDGKRQEPAEANRTSSWQTKRIDAEKWIKKDRQTEKVILLILCIKM